jgi:penicillin-binding protein 1A
MRGVTGGSSPAAIWRGFMEAALPRLNAPAIPNGPAMPEGWVPPSPVENLIGRIGDIFGDSPAAGEGDPLDDPGLEPDPREPAPPRRNEPGPAVVRPTAPQPQREEPAQRPEPTPPPEKKTEPLFF